MKLRHIIGLAGALLLALLSQPDPVGEQRPASLGVGLSPAHSLVGGGELTAPRSLPIAALGRSAWAAPGSGAFGHLPLAFAENQGQWDTPACFVARRGGVTTRVEPDALVLEMIEPQREAAPRDGPFRCPTEAAFSGEQARPRRGVVVRLAFENASLAMVIRADRPLPGYFNYFLGNDSTRWRTRVPGYGVVTYQGVQAGVDIVLHARDGQLEYDVCLAPRADLDQIVIRCEGIEGLHIDEQGNLVMATALGPIVQHVPRTWEETESGERVPVTCRYRLIDAHRYGFAVKARNASRRLVIDPGLTWATYLGGGLGDFPSDVDTAANGDVIVAGGTQSADFPVTPGAFDVIPNVMGPMGDMFVTRLTGDGDALVFSTFIGGSQGDGIGSIFVDAADRITIAGGTGSTDYPITPGAYSSTYQGNLSDAVITQLSAAGDALLYSTLIGGFNPTTSSEVALAVIPRSDGTLIVTGGTCAPNFPVTPDAMDMTYQGVGCDGFISVLDPAAVRTDQLVYSSFFFSGAFVAISLQEDGSVLGAGTTYNSGFPTTPGAFDTNFAGTNNFLQGIVCRLSPDLKTLLASTFLDATIQDVAFGSDGSVTVFGDGVDSLITPGAYASMPVDGGVNVLIGRIDGSLSRWEWGARIGGINADGANGGALDSTGAAMVTGITNSSNFPVTAGAHDTTYSGGLGDAFVSYLSADGSQLLYSSFLGNSGGFSISGRAITASGIAEAVVLGDGLNLPVTPGAFDTSFNGGNGDAFVVKLPLAGPWASVGTGIAGTNGIPKLSGSGQLCAGETVTLTLIRGKPNGSATLVVGLGLLQIPFKGGTLIPSPDILITGLPINANGTLILSAPWPAGVPSGFTIYFQDWIADPVAVQGFAASNGLSGTTP